MRYQVPGLQLLEAYETIVAASPVFLPHTIESDIDLQ